MNWELIKIRAACRGINLFTAEEELARLEGLPMWMDDPATLTSFLHWSLDPNYD